MAVRTWPVRGSTLALAQPLTRHSAPPPPSVFHQGSIRDWRDIHSGVMGSEPVDPRGVATETDPAVYGVCHSDINSSNYFFNAAGDDGESPFICAFDWDQVCAGKGWGVDKERCLRGSVVAWLRALRCDPRLVAMPRDSICFLELLTHTPPVVRVRRSPARGFCTTLRSRRSGRTSPPARTAGLTIRPPPPTCCKTSSG